MEYTKNKSYDMNNTFFVNTPHESQVNFNEPKINPPSESTNYTFDSTSPINHIPVI